jgi:hypothetical protein
LGDFLAERSVEIVASLPYYLPRQTDAQRGPGVFEGSITALRGLNEIGYGREDSGLVLNLVTNPVGAFLPGHQPSLERDFKRELRRRYNVEFNRLFTITNMPIARFLVYLQQSGNLQGYMERLVQAFNPQAAEGVMCRFLVSVSWDGRIYDCDFNQMLDLPLAARPKMTVFDFDWDQLVHRRIATGQHCFGCTAGGGSSCAGATTWTPSQEGLWCVIERRSCRQAPGSALWRTGPEAPVSGPLRTGPRRQNSPQGTTVGACRLPQPKVFPEILSEPAHTAGSVHGTAHQARFPTCALTASGP